MKLQTQFTVPKKDMRNLYYVKKLQTLEKTLKQSCEDYPSEEDCLVCSTKYQKIIIFCK